MNTHGTAPSDLPTEAQSGKVYGRLAIIHAYQLPLSTPPMLSKERSNSDKNYHQSHRISFLQLSGPRESNSLPRKCEPEVLSNEPYAFNVYNTLTIFINKEESYLNNDIFPFATTFSPSMGKQLTLQTQTEQFKGRTLVWQV